MLVRAPHSRYLIFASPEIPRTFGRGAPSFSSPDAAAHHCEAAASSDGDVIPNFEGKIITPFYRRGN